MKRITVVLFLFLSILVCSSIANASYNNAYELYQALQLLDNASTKNEQLEGAKALGYIGGFLFEKERVSVC